MFTEQWRQTRENVAILGAVLCEEWRGKVDGQVLTPDFSLEQRQYILSLLEQGVNFEEIKSLADPKFPVDVMKGLRKNQERREKDVSVKCRMKKD